MLDLAERMPRASVLLLEDGPLVEACRHRGIPVEVWAMGAAIGKVRTDSRVLAGLAAAPQMLGTIVRLAGACRKADVVVAVSLKSMALLAFACRLSGRPLIWMLNDIITAGHFSQAMRKVIVRLANLMATRVVTNSKATADAFVAAGGRAALTDVRHVGIDPAPFLGRRAASRSELGLPEDVYLLGLFGRVSPWKGQHVLVEALAALPDDVHAVLVGGNLFGSEDYAASVAARAAALGVEHRVHWLGHRAQVAALMSGCDVIVHASTEPEPFGRVVVEGLLAGKPVVATIGGGVVEIVQDGVDGCLVPPKDPEALAAAVLRLRADPQAAAEMAKVGHRRAIEHFSLDHMVAAFQKIVTTEKNRPAWRRLARAAS